MIRGFIAASLSIVACAVAAELPKGVKAPPGMNVTVYAAPPNIGYPTCLAATPSGHVFVGVDENGSLDAKANRGRVVRCVDANGDGVADEFKTFARMDSPRGLWFENNVLYVQHPPFVTAFYDENGDGESDRSEVLVRGLGFDLKFRGADHTINGMQMGIDGFLYIACGDYGATNAVGKDGTRIQLYGGGVVRVRPDGTGLEIVSRGQRNIYDVAISPEMDLFTRDNTNDGGGWDVRLSHVVMFGQYGYPTLYKNSPHEIVAPLADYGGGSPCGSLFMDEPGFPDGLGTALYTCEWGRSKIYRHPLERQGATYTTNTPQLEFMDVPRVTDMEVDGAGRIYVASWAGGGFNYSGPNVGYVLRVVPQVYTVSAFPDLKKATNRELLNLIGSRTAVRRLYAQREILRRGNTPAIVDGLVRLASSDAILPCRIAAVFTLEQLLGANAHATLAPLAKINDLRESVVRALGNDSRRASSVPSPFLVSALTDNNARVRLQAVTALGRLKKTDAASAMLPLVDDDDAVVSHVTINALAEMRAIDAYLAALDSAGSANLVPGLIRVLAQIHDSKVVDGLLARLENSSTAPARQHLLHGLARLYNREAVWDGRWWGTRPDTTGPYFKPVTWEASERIATVLRKELATADSGMVRWLAVELQKNRVDLPELTDVVLKLAAADPDFRSVAVDFFSRRSALPSAAVPLLKAVALSKDAETSLRSRAMRSLHRASASSNAFHAILESLVSVSTGRQPGEFNSVWEEFVRDNRHASRLPVFETLANTGSTDERTLAYGVLASLATQKLASKEARASASTTVDRAWSHPESCVPLLRALARLRNDQYSLQVRSLVGDSRPEIAAAAREAAGQLRSGKSKSNDAPIERMQYDEVLAIAQKDKGDVKLGRELYARQGCVACHTTTADEPPKGPYLGDIATRYSRAELCESIIKPNAKVAQGFETQWFQTKDDEELEGFVSREGGDDLDVRNVAGITTTLAKKQISARGKREKSMMPEGLVDKLTAAELASLLAYLESLKSH